MYLHGKMVLKITQREETVFYHSTVFNITLNDIALLIEKTIKLLLFLRELSYANHIYKDQIYFYTTSQFILLMISELP